MPWNYKPWGCGSGAKGSCNNGWIQFEICEDNLKNRDYAEKVWKEAIELSVYLCKMYNLNPLGVATCGSTNVPVITCHNDSAKYGCGCNHADINHWFPALLGKNMENARQEIAAMLNSGVVITQPQIITTPTTTTEEYNMRTIKKGSTGTAVKIWQVIIGTTVDGAFGKNTETATKNFQRKNGLVVDGIVGPNTWKVGLNSVK